MTLESTPTPPVPPKSPLWTPAKKISMQTPLTLDVLRTIYGKHWDYNKWHCFCWKLSCSVDQETWAYTHLAPLTPEEWERCHLRRLCLCCRQPRHLAKNYLGTIAFPQSPRALTPSTSPSPWPINCFAVLPEDPTESQTSSPTLRTPSPTPAATPRSLNCPTLPAIPPPEIPRPSNVIQSVTVEETPYYFSPFVDINNSLFSHLPFEDFVLL